MSKSTCIGSSNGFCSTVLVAVAILLIAEFGAAKKEVVSMQVGMSEIVGNGCQMNGYDPDNRFSPESKLGPVRTFSFGASKETCENHKPGSTMKILVVTGRIMGLSFCKPLEEN